MAKIVITSLFASNAISKSYQKMKDLNKSTQNKIDHEIETYNDALHALEEINVNEIVQSIILCAMKKKVDNLILFLDSMNDSVQESALIILKDKIGISIDIEIIRVDGNSLFAVAREIVNTIDSFDSEKDEISINVNLSENAKTLGMIYGSCVRSERIKEIMYVDIDKRKIVKIPKISLKLNKNQRKILQYFKDRQEKKVLAWKKIYNYLGLDKSSYYYILKQLKEKGYLNDDGTLTELGEVVLL